MKHFLRAVVIMLSVTLAVSIYYYAGKRRCDERWGGYFHSYHNYSLFGGCVLGIFFGTDIPEDALHYVVNIKRSDLSGDHNKDE